MVQATIKAIGGKKGCTIMDIRKYVCANYIVEDTETISSRLRIAVRKMLVTRDIYKVIVNGVDFYRFPLHHEYKVMRWDSLIYDAVKTMNKPNGCSRKDILQHVRANNSAHSHLKQIANKYTSSFRKALNELLMCKMLVKVNENEDGGCSYYTLPVTDSE